MGIYEHKYAAYADDILFYIQQPTTTLPNLMLAFKNFGLISNFKMNLSKFKILSISLPAIDVTHLKPSFHFAWQTRTLKYVGILLTIHPANLFRANYIPLLNSKRQYLHKWNHLANSWLGRISVVKMNILLRVLFIFQMIPYKIASIFFSGFDLIGTQICVAP